MTPAPRWPDDFTFLGSTVLPSAPAPLALNGDSPYGKGLALRLESDDSLTLFTGSWNPQVILTWRVTRPFTGPAVYRGNLGTIPMRGELYGLHWDLPTASLLASSNSSYDSDPAVNLTLGRAQVDPTTGRLVPTGAFNFSRSDKMTQGGVTALPEWFQSAYGVGRLAAGFGGYASIIATGPASMGPALAAFTPPAVDTRVGTLAATALLGYPFSEAPGTPAAERDTDYVQCYGWGWWPKQVAAPPGWWVPGDSLWQGCAYVDTAAVSGLVCVPMIHNGCNWYGSNATPPTLPSCSATPGKAASLNSQRARHWVYIYDPADLGAVALGQKAQNAIQATQRVPLELPGVLQPLVGWPGIPRMVTGVSFEPTAGLFAIMIRNTSASSGRPTIFWYQVRKTRPYTCVATTTVQAGNEAQALALAQAQTAQWVVVP